eukprot:710133_1
MSEDGDAEEELKYSIHYEGEEEASEYYTKDGKAKVTYANGDTFEGELTDGQKNGKGIYFWKELNATYDGEWIMSIRKGHGKTTYSDGSKYEGEWDNNCQHGKGTYMYENGDSYCGQFINGKREGQGIYSYNDDHSQLIGMWKDDKFISGEWRYNNNTKFIGSFDHNIPNGKGSFVFPSKNQNNGTYVNGAWQSQSILYNEM